MVKEIEFRQNEVSLDLFAESVPKGRCACGGAFESVGAYQICNRCGACELG